jgi:phosphoglycerate dehydrogenase-like enzyme
MSEYVDSRRPAVLICDAVDPAGIEMLGQIADVDTRLGLTQEELIELIPGYEVVIVRSATKLPAHVIEHGLNLKVIGRAGSGLDNIDVVAAKERGIQVVNSPGANAVAVAEHTMGLLLSLARRLPTADLSLKAGRWDKKNLMGTGLAGKTLGIVGFGRIGREVAIRAQAFGLKILVNQRRPTPELGLVGDIQTVDLNELLNMSDFVSLHVPMTPETKNMMAMDQFRRMKSTAFLINTARGDLIDERALLQALDEGIIAGAALDVFAQEPAVDSDLARHERVIATPHIAASTEDAQIASIVTVAKQIAEILEETPVETILPLRVVSLDRVVCHEDVDPKRVDRLAKRIEADGILRSPPIVVESGQHYVVLDGASRTTAMRQLGYPHIIVQLTSLEEGLELDAWGHVISDVDPDVLVQMLDDLPLVRLEEVETGRAADVMFEYGGLCRLKTITGGSYVVYAASGENRLDALNALTATYVEAGRVERTLKRDIISLQHEIEGMTALVIYPVFTPDQVMLATQLGNRHFPAGITRFLVPGRILRINVALERLKSGSSLQEKNRWLHEMLLKRQGAGAIRYYGEPVYILDD